MPSSSSRPFFWMVVGCGFFAVMSVLGHAAGERCDWQTVAFVRSFLVLLFVGGWSVYSGTPLVFFRPIGLWLRSLAGSFSLVTGFYALAKLHASTVTTLTSTYPIWVALLSWPMLRVLPSPRVWLAVIGGVAGVYLIQQPQGETGDIAIILALVSAFSTAVAMIGLHRLKGVNPNAVVVHFSAVAAACSLLAFAIFDTRLDATPFYDPIVLALLIGVGLTASGGQMLLTRAFAAGDPSRVSVVGLSQVLFTLVIDVIFTSHEVTLTICLGTLLIIVPTAWVMIERQRSGQQTRGPQPVTESGTNAYPAGAR